MKNLRLLLLPFSLLYGLVVIIRNWLYDSGIFKSTNFELPVICVGNLDVGGAGKSPMTEYLIRLLKADYKLATLSRGYGRQTKGFLFAVSESKNLSSTVGDEPAQFKYKFLNVTVAVCEDRVAGISRLKTDHDLILLDDAYQHRAVEAGLNILLFDFSRVNDPHFLLPAGNLREPFSGRWRAQVLIISKCPVTLSVDEQNALAENVAPLPYQQLFFTSIVYEPLRDLNGNAVNVFIDEDTSVFLLTGIANPAPLLKHINDLTANITHHKYPDHHPFTIKNITKLADAFENNKSQKKVIITTEKDAQRLDESWFNQGPNGAIKLPVFVLPISVAFLNDSGKEFDKTVINYVRKHTTHH